MGVEVPGQRVPREHDASLPCAKHWAEGDGVVTRRTLSQRDGLSERGLAGGRGCDDEVIGWQGVEAEGAGGVGYCCAPDCAAPSEGNCGAADRLGCDGRAHLK